jgi:hypothetical protein
MSGPQKSWQVLTPVQCWDVTIGRSWLAKVDRGGCFKNKACHREAARFNSLVKVK